MESTDDEVEEVQSSSEKKQKEVQSSSKEKQREVYGPSRKKPNKTHLYDTESLYETDSFTYTNPELKTKEILIDGEFIKILSEEMEVDQTDSDDYFDYEITFNDQNISGKEYNKMVPDEKLQTNYINAYRKKERSKLSDEDKQRRNENDKMAKRNKGKKLPKYHWAKRPEKAVFYELSDFKYECNHCHAHTF
jgi:hypothetical protein